MLSRKISLEICPRLVVVCYHLLPIDTCCCPPTAAYRRAQPKRRYEDAFEGELLPGVALPQVRCHCKTPAIYNLCRERLRSARAQLFWNDSIAHVCGSKLMNMWIQRRKRLFLEQRKGVFFVFCSWKIQLFFFVSFLRSLRYLAPLKVYLCIPIQGTFELRSGVLPPPPPPRDVVSV